jgi:DNA polymerase III alpha subunit
VLAPGRTRPRESDHVSGWSVPRRLSEELQLLGLAVTCHPLDLAHADLVRRGVTFAKDLPGLPDGSFVRIVGLRERAQTPRTRSGRRTCFLTMEDATGLLDATVFEDVLNRSGETIVKHRCYLVEGTLQNNPERGLAIVARRVEPYVIKAEGGSNVRLRRAVGQASLGPFRGSAGAPEEDSWDEVDSGEEARDTWARRSG